MTTDRRRLLLVSDGSEWSGYAFAFLRRRFRCPEWYAWDYGDPHTRSFEDWPGTDILLSFKSDMLLPAWMLDRVSQAAINFHPSLPCYRGIGGYTYALDEGLSEFGATCHHISTDIDAGTLVDVRRFAIIPGETEDSLIARTASVALTQLYEITSLLLEGAPLPRSDEQWGKRLYTRSGLEAYRLDRANASMLA